MFFGENFLPLHLRRRFVFSIAFVRRWDKLIIRFDFAAPRLATSEHFFARRRWQMTFFHEFEKSVVGPRTNAPDRRSSTPCELPGTWTIFVVQHSLFRHDVFIILVWLIAVFSYQASSTPTWRSLLPLFSLVVELSVALQTFALSISPQSINTVGLNITVARSQ